MEAGPSPEDGGAAAEAEGLGAQTPGAKAHVGIVKVLRQKCDDLEDQLDAETQAKERAHEELKELEGELFHLRESLEKSHSEKQEAAAQVEELRQQLEEAQQPTSDASQEARPQDGAKESLPDEAEAAEPACVAELRALSETLAQERDSAQQRAKDLASELEAERIAHGNEQSELAEVSRTLDEERYRMQTASSACEDEKQRAADLQKKLECLEQASTTSNGVAEELERERWRVASLEEEVATLRLQTDSYTELQDRHQALSDELHSEKQAKETHQDAAGRSQAELEKLQQAHGEEAERLTAECARLRAELGAHADERGKAQGELELSTEAHTAERRRAEELQANLGTVQSAHEDLFARYAKAVEELDGLRSQHQSVSQERDGLRTSLAEAERLRKEQEEAEPPGPQQLSVSDVLISVSFEGVSSPLQLRPWDTNIDDVVSQWLTTAQRSRVMQASLVRYLRHLEDTATSFPVVQAARLVEVHEAFAL